MLSMVTSESTLSKMILNRSITSSEESSDLSWISSLSSWKMRAGSRPLKTLLLTPLMRSPLLKLAFGDHQELKDLNHSFNKLSLTMRMEPTKLMILAIMSTLTILTLLILIGHSASTIRFQVFSTWLN